ncbi:FtsK/SpoIIIE domain-containing protein, partial [Bacillus cereus]
TKNYVYPTISRVCISDTHVEIVGHIPKGMNPSVFQQKEYIFQQYFGENIAIHTGVSYFKIQVFPERMDFVPYSYEDFPIENMKMPIVAGKDRFNQWVAFSMIKNPNVLIAGIPGSGKSVMCRQLLTTLMLHHTAKELEIHLLDLKGSEFHIFEHCEHVKSMSVTVQEFSPTMRMLRKELDRRGRVLREHGVAHIDKLPKGKRMNYVLLMIDEVLLLNDGTKEGKEVKEMLLKWAALGRALGCFTVISLQRPCHKSLDTALRGVLNVRAVFKTEDKTNSEIAGVVGAEKILREESGRMIFKIDTDDMKDVQAPFLEVEEAQELIEPFLCRKSNETKEMKGEEVFNLLG